MYNVAHSPPRTKNLVFEMVTVLSDDDQPTEPVVCTAMTPVEWVSWVPKEVGAASAAVPDVMISAATIPTAAPARASFRTPGAVRQYLTCEQNTDGAGPPS